MNFICNKKSLTFSEVVCKIIIVIVIKLVATIANNLYLNDVSQSAKHLHHAVSSPQQCLEVTCVIICFIDYQIEVSRGLVNSPRVWKWETQN